jgi:hypothetical protein
MQTDYLQLPGGRHTTTQTESGPTLIACSLCLRVLRGSEWLEAERVISEIRSYELADPPQLKAGLCDVCAASILKRRADVDEPLAA